MNAKSLLIRSLGVSAVVTGLSIADPPEANGCSRCVQLDQGYYGCLDNQASGLNYCIPPESVFGYCDGSPGCVSS